MMSTGVCQWLFLMFSLSTWTVSNSKETRVVCYYTNWSVYRPGDAKFTPQNINPYLCTHLIYAFGGFTKENTLKPFDKYQDIEKGGYAKFTGLKTYNKNLKTMLAIGGWNEGSTRFSPLVANPERRKELVKNAIKFLRQNHFDGLDLDWEYPSFRDGGKPRDRDNYAQLVQELREEFERESDKTGRPRLLLTMAVPAGIEYINKGYDVPKLTKYLDWMNILSYDYHSAFEPAVNHHAPLFSLEEDNEYNYDAELNIDYTIKHYLKNGADPSKLVLGIPTYGRSYTLFNPDAFEMGSPADGPGTMGEATRENGYLAYYEICDYVKNEEWEVEQPNPEAMGPYAFKENQWVGYDDDNIVRKKAEYVAKNGLGGIMFWAIDNDDFRGKCHDKPYPLIEAGKEALLNAYGLTDENLISPSSKPIKSRTRTRTKATKTNTVIEEEKSSAPIVSRRRNRIKLKEKESDNDVSKSRRTLRRKNSNSNSKTSTYSSLSVVTPSYTTPAPPSTPDMGGAFKCEDEGFFSHPKDCKKYFWCLSGPGDSGIVAHQFTCPAGLYFNKAADSCDYTQNVLCNKKLQKSKSTTTSTSRSETSSSTSTTSAAVVSTTRAPPKITAATSRTTFKQTTTTEAYQEEYEYEDDEEDEEDDSPDTSSKISRKDSEEDPQVIKELIDLIKKAGGIEELEKQLRPRNSSSSAGDTTTPSSFEKSLYQRVLNKALQNSLISKKKTYTGVRNSRGPQSEGLKESGEEKVQRGKLTYSSISRNRPTTSTSTTESAPTSEKSRQRKQFELEYVNIRRNRFSLTTESNENDSILERNRILGESDDENEDNNDTEEDEDEEEEKSKNRNTFKTTFTPQYINIRRERPSTTEAASTSKYVEIRRSTTPNDVTEEPETQTSKYKIIRRGSTTASPEIETTTEESQSKRSTTISNLHNESSSLSESSKRPTVSTELTSLSSSTDNATEFVTNSTPASTSSAPVETTTSQQPLKNRYVSNLRPNFRIGVRQKLKTTTVSSISSTSSKPTTTAASSTQIRLSTPKPFSRPTKILLSRRKYQTQAVTAAYGPVLESQGKPLFTTRYRFVPRKEKTTKIPFDLASESSNQQSLEKDIENKEKKKIKGTTSSIEKTTTSSNSLIDVNKDALQAAGKRKIRPVITTPRAEVTTPITYHTVRKIPTRSRSTYSSLITIPMSTSTTIKSVIINQQKRPPSAFNYYDRLQTTILDGIPEHTKVLLHSNGIIECLDQGNFPHPVSCKKFISCAKMDLGKVLGWEYTCPKGLSFDPIGGMCNWSADLECDEE